MAGRVRDPAETVALDPQRPYTGALIAAVPVADPDRAALRQRVPLHSQVPSPTAPPPGCRFHPRCPKAQVRCREKRPVLRALGDGRTAACHFPLSPEETPLPAG